MGAAVGRTLDQTWIRMMIEHQEGASRFADIMLRSHTTEPVRSAAERVKQESHERIAALKQLREASLSTDTSTADPFGGVVSDTFARMTHVQGTSVAQTWALKMAAYDRGAVTLAGIEATKGQDARVRNLARKLASALANEADQLEALKQDLPLRSEGSGNITSTIPEISLTRAARGNISRIIEGIEDEGPGSRQRA